MQPAADVYVINVLPSEIPETSPDAEPTVAIVVLLLLQVPPVTASLNVDEAPVQKSVFPEIADTGFTVTVEVAIHAVGAVYVIIVVPPVIPVTVPDVPTVATPELLLLHPPPAVASVRFVDSPSQTLAVPVTDAGNGLIVTVVFPSVPQHPVADKARK